MSSEIPSAAQEARKFRIEAARLHESYSNTFFKAVNLLENDSDTHIYLAGRVADLAMLPITAIQRWHLALSPTTAFRRFLKYSEGKYLAYKVGDEKKSYTPYLFADHGDPIRSSRIELGVLESNELMVFQWGQPNICATRDNPSYIGLPTMGDYSRVDNTKYRPSRQASSEDIEKYTEILDVLKNPPSNSVRLKFKYGHFKKPQ